MMMQLTTAAWAAPASGKQTEPAPDLRMKVTAPYAEFGLLAWSAILTASGGKKQEGRFRDAAAALDENANRLARVYAQTYGDKAGSDFAALWKKQVAAVLEYAQAVAAKNTAAAEQSSRYLMDVYPNQMAAFLGGLTRASVETIAPPTKEYLASLKAAAEAQAARDYNIEYRAVDKMYAALIEIAHSQAQAMVKQFPTQYVGNMDMPAVNLRVRLYCLFAQQIFALGMANRANVSGNIDEHYALYARSDLLTDEASRELTTFAGTEFGTAFSALWKKYTASLQDYEKAREAQDSTMQKRVIGDLKGEVDDLVALFVPPAPARAVPPPRKGGKKPKAPPPPPFQKDVRAFVDANVGIIVAATRGSSPFGALQKAWHETRDFTDAMTALIVARFGDKPQSSAVQSEGDQK